MPEIAQTRIYVCVCMTMIYMYVCVCIYIVRYYAVFFLTLLFSAFTAEIFLYSSFILVCCDVVKSALSFCNSDEEKAKAKRRKRGPDATFREFFVLLFCLFLLLFTPAGGHDVTRGRGTPKNNKIRLRGGASPGGPAF